MRESVRAQAGGADEAVELVGGDDADESLRRTPLVISIQGTMEAACRTVDLVAHWGGMGWARVHANYSSRSRISEDSGSRFDPTLEQATATILPEDPVRIRLRFRAGYSRLDRLAESIARSMGALGRVEVVVAAPHGDAALEVLDALHTVATAVGDCLLVLPWGGWEADAPPAARRRRASAASATGTGTGSDGDGISTGSSDCASESVAGLPMVSSPASASGGGLLEGDARVRVCRGARLGVARASIAAEFDVVCCGAAVSMHPSTSASVAGDGPTHWSQFGSSDSVIAEPSSAPLPTHRAPFGSGPLPAMLPGAVRGREGSGGGAGSGNRRVGRWNDGGGSDGCRAESAEGDGEGLIAVRHQGRLPLATLGDFRGSTDLLDAVPVRVRGRGVGSGPLDTADGGSGVVWPDTSSSSEKTQEATTTDSTSRSVSWLGGATPQHSVPAGVMSMHVPARVSGPPSKVWTAIEHPLIVFDNG